MPIGTNMEYIHKRVETVVAFWCNLPEPLHISRRNFPAWISLFEVMHFGQYRPLTIYDRPPQYPLSVTPSPIYGALPPILL